MKLIAGLDVGTTGCKITVFTSAGENLGREYRSYQVERGTGFEELSPNRLAAAVRECVNAAVERFGKIEALGVTSFGESFVLTDSQGMPLRPIMLCTDNRGAEEVAELSAKIGADRIAAITGVKPNETYSLGKILWIQKHEPGVFEKAAHAMLIEDFVIFLLTGERKIDYSLATRTMAFDFRTLDWSAEMLAAADLPQDFFSEPVPTGSVCGEYNGIRIVACGHDQVAAATGAGVFTPGSAVDGAGTCECVTPVYTEIPEGIAFQNNNYNVAPYHGGSYVCYAYSFTGGALVDWAVRFLGKSHEELTPQDYRPTGLLILPHFAGAATPYMDSGSKGAAVGLTLATSPQDLYAACLEGVAYEMRINRDRLAESGVVYSRLVATGGGAKSKLWCQIKADVLGVPVVSLETDEAGTVGCAMMAGVASGAFADLETACRTMVRETGIYEPNPARTAEYDRIYLRYAKLYDTVRPLV